MEIALIENIQREDLNPIEEAKAYQHLINEYKLKQDDVAERVSKSRAAIANSMRLLKLDERVQQMVMDNMISNGHARALLAISDGDKQYMIAQQIFDEKLSVRETEKLMKLLDKKKEEPKEKDVARELIYHELEEKVKSVLGTKVSIHNRKNNKGKIEIEYYSQDELERIMDMLQSIK